ncbi:hypothetical protein GHT09_011370 [Marmota monax]|uniref:Uncharacterized protein n=1 Tax=Marmota monax TaxID=9995 RepID=A0A834PNR8_MARMO|nr:hypothetical protein GHT09_011370 [Marmota monax]
MVAAAEPEVSCQSTATCTDTAIAAASHSAAASLRLSGGLLSGCRCHRRNCCPDATEANTAADDRSYPDDAAHTDAVAAAVAAANNHPHPPTTTTATMA